MFKSHFYQNLHTLVTRYQSQALVLSVKVLTQGSWQSEDTGYRNNGPEVGKGLTSVHRHTSLNCQKQFQ